MPRPTNMRDYRDLTDAQLQILGALWELETGTINDIHKALGPRGGIARKTIATLLSRMERRGLVKHRFEGRAGIYRPMVTRRAVLLSRMTGVLGAVFGRGSGGGAAAAAVSREDV